MATWKVPGPPARWAQSTHPILVGRRSELRVLADAWEHAKGGARQVVLLGGEAGAGKTRLAAEAAARSSADSGAILLGTCVAEFGPAYQPFVEPVQMLASAVAAGQLNGVSADQLDQLRSLGGRGHLADQDNGDGRERRQRLLDAVVTVVRSASSVNPVLLVLDDLQWASDSGLEVLLRLVEDSADFRLLLIARRPVTTGSRSTTARRAHRGRSAAASRYTSLRRGRSERHMAPRLGGSRSPAPGRFPRR